MRTILCFGDSNTYGYRPDTGERYAEDTRWTGILREKLKDRKIEVIEEGLVGRTTVFEDSIRPGRKGIDYLVPLLETHAPVDELVLMLGTNDCKSIYKASPEVIGLGIERLIKGDRAFNPKLEILLISPIYLGDDVWKEGYDPEFDQESVQRRHDCPVQKTAWDFFPAYQIQWKSGWKNKNNIVKNAEINRAKIRCKSCVFSFNILYL